MAKKNTQDYIKELTQMVERSSDNGLDPWLLPLLRTTAMNMVLLDKMQTQLEVENFTDSLHGSMGQEKINVHPLLDKYDKMQNTLIRQFDALGLTAKGKVANTGNEQEDEDPVLTMLSKK